MDDQADEEYAEKPSRSKKGKRQASAAKPKAKAKRAKKGLWDAEHVMTDPNSPLVHVDLREALSKPGAWDVLSSEEKQELIKLLPDDGRHIIYDDDGEPRLDPYFLKNSVDWHHAVRCVQEDIEDGRNDIDWQREAYIAHKERAAGVFDEWKEAEKEQYWGMKHIIPEEVLMGKGKSTST